MDDLSIRPARPEDQADLLRGLIALQAYECALHETRLPAEASAEPYLKWMLNQIERQDGLCLVASLGSDFIGFVTGWVERVDNPAETEDSTAFGYISDICLLPDWRQRGYSGALLAAMEDYFRAKAIRRLRISSLAANQAALAAYHSAGFQPYEVTLEKILG